MNTCKQNVTSCMVINWTFCSRVHIVITICDYRVRIGPKWHVSLSSVISTETTKAHYIGPFLQKCQIRPYKGWSVRSPPIFSLTRNQGLIWQKVLYIITNLRNASERGKTGKVCGAPLKLWCVVHHFKEGGCIVEGHPFTPCIGF